MQRAFGLVQGKHCVWRIEMGPASFVVERCDHALVHIGIVGLSSSPHITSQIRSDAFTVRALPLWKRALESGPNSENDAQRREKYKGTKYVKNYSALQKGDLFGFPYTQVM